MRGCEVVRGVRGRGPVRGVRGCGLWGRMLGHPLMLLNSRRLQQSLSFGTWGRKGSDKTRNSISRGA